MGFFSNSTRLDLKHTSKPGLERWHDRLWIGNLGRWGCPVKVAGKKTVRWKFPSCVVCFFLVKRKCWRFVLVGVIQYIFIDMLSLYIYIHIYIYEIYTQVIVRSFLSISLYLHDSKLSSVWVPCFTHVRQLAIFGLHSSDFIARQDRWEQELIRKNVSMEGVTGELRIPFGKIGEP